MSSMIKINLVNTGNVPQKFFFFQTPAQYTGGSDIYSNSIQNVTLSPNGSFASSYTFLINTQFFAGVQQTFSAPQVGKQSGYLSSIRPINLTPSDPALASGNAVAFSNSESTWGLGAPSADQTTQKGAFRISAPTFDSNVNFINAGSAVQLNDGSIVLSSFTNLLPNQNVDCQPIQQFYVQTGGYTPGTVMNFSAASTTAALCDATTGNNDFNVIYNPDGTWSVTSGFAML